MSKESTKAALERYYEKHARSSERVMKRQGRKNKKPEKELEKEVLAWAVRAGFDLHVIEAKAVFSQAAGRYLRGQAQSGLPDLVGNHGHIAIYVELKAKGKRSTLKPHQRHILERKIKQGCFAACIDRVECFENLWSTWLITPEVDRVELLLSDLP